LSLLAGKLVAGGMVAGGLLLGLYLWKKDGKQMSDTGSTDDAAPPSTDPAPGTPPLNAALLAAGHELLPAPSLILRPGAPELDPVYGGRLPGGGDGKWRYYETGHGTTCGVTLAYLMGRAGWPGDLVNRDPDDAYGAPGGGFEIGAHISKIVGGALRRHWYLEPGPGVVPRPGDAYHVDRPPKVNSDHVGLVESISSPRSDGTRLLVTVDGGQGATGADVKRSTRTLSADGRTLATNGAPARMLGWIRASQTGEGLA